MTPWGRKCCSAKSVAAHRLKAEANKSSSQMLTNSSLLPRNPAPLWPLMIYELLQKRTRAPWGWPRANPTKREQPGANELRWVRKVYFCCFAPLCLCSADCKRPRKIRKIPSERRNIDPRPRIGRQPAALALIYKQKMTLAEKKKQSQVGLKRFILVD